jgi:BASS family bile acid:Na+ symporter
MPSIAFTLSIIFRLPPEIAIGVILVGACPSGTASNVIAYLAKGNTALSVACTSISTLLSPILTPVVILLFASKWLPVSVGDLIWSVAKMVILPIFLGFIVKIFFKKQVEKSVEVLPLVSVIGIVAIVAAVVSSSRESILDTGMLVFGVVILHNLFGYLLGFLLSKWLKLSYSDQKAIAIEVGMQNSGLGAALAAAHFNPVAAVPSAIFSFWHNISGPLLATYWGNKAAKRQKTANPSEQSTKSTII